MSAQQDTVLQKLRQLPVDLSLVELFPAEEDNAYFCTPLGARILGRIGVDGVHFCDVPSLGLDLVFAVTPMGEAPFVYPVATDLHEFLAEVYTCGSAGSIEQLIGIAPERAADFLQFNRALCIGSDDADELQQAYDFFGMDGFSLPEPGKNTAVCHVLNVMADTFALEPIKDIYAHIQSVRRSFDVKNLSFSDEYDNL